MNSINSLSRLSGILSKWSCPISLRSSSEIGSIKGLIISLWSFEKIFSKNSSKNGSLDESLLFIVCIYVSIGVSGLSITPNFNRVGRIFWISLFKKSLSRKVCSSSGRIFIVSYNAYNLFAMVLISCEIFLIFSSLRGSILAIANKESTDSL